MTARRAAGTPRNRAEAAAWAAGLLAAPAGAVVVVDTETTGLDGYCCELAVTDTAGRLVLGARLDPGVACEPDAEAAHRLGRADLACGVCFADVADALQVVLHDRTVVAYNAAFDRGILRNDLARVFLAGLGRVRGLHRDDRPQTAAGAAEAWLTEVRFVCAMEAYAVFAGETHRQGGFRWPPLPGGDHTAYGDCLATVALLRRMAADAPGHGTRGNREGVRQWPR